MVKLLKIVLRRAALRSGILLAAAAFAPAAAQSLSDPTRPPASLGSGHDGGRQSVASGPVLQSVLISPERKVAIISGQAVKLGEKFGDARVTKITESEVMLSSSNGVRALKLFPGIEKDVAFDRKPLQAERRRQ
jgi:MSHA biogenesis protein MshK